MRRLMINFAIFVGEFFCEGDNMDCFRLKKAKSLPPRKFAMTSRLIINARPDQKPTICQKISRNSQSGGEEFK